MPDIGAYEAKTHLPSSSSVWRRANVVITRHGKPVAELVPVATRDVAAITPAIADARAVRQRLRRRGVGSRRPRQAKLA
jgi:antitoxin (DNA-binding transcriptional repressor) of toxin-antitoxin stability system